MQRTVHGGPEGNMELSLEHGPLAQWDHRARCTLSRHTMQYYYLNYCLSKKKNHSLLASTTMFIGDE